MPHLDYNWHLRAIMAQNGMYSTTDLRPLLAQHGVTLSASQVYRLVTEKPERLSLKTLVALTEILGCSVDQLIEPVHVRSENRKISSGDHPTPTRRTAVVGDFRPRRARIVKSGDE